jgi:hypothetical protein
MGSCVVTAVLSVVDRTSNLDCTTVERRALAPTGPVVR